MTRALKCPSDTGQFWVGNDVEPEESLDVTLIKSSEDPVERQWPITRRARYSIMSG